ncbi:hypothetical protein [Peribacillus frigoritolerans]|uniref:hypothetical protein n=1 Tax=Peribacillus frigoritolerans TaxID=450367 RepID=UPI002E1B778F|nr:hypothetical protein [Peribacillus frigoritolerans]MED3845560.1 hypothetical protein [Peribacillus frigoritolerans]
MGRTITLEFNPGDKVQTTEQAAKLCGGRHIAGVVDSVIVTEYNVYYEVLHNSGGSNGMAYKLTKFPEFALKVLE